MTLYLFYWHNLTGVGRHAEAFRRALLATDGAPPVQDVELDDSAAVARAVAQAGPGDVAFFFTMQEPDFLQKIKCRKIIWFAFESDHAPAKMRALLNCFDAIWTPSGWGRRVLIDSGIDAAKIVAVPEGVDSTIYFPQRSAYPGFVFLSVGKYEKRKAIDEVIAAFLDAFPAEAFPAVSLWLKAEYLAMPQRIEALKARITDTRIRIFSGFYSEAEMAALYNHADCFVFPSRAEGFGLPCIEALACGVPTIATSYSGQSEYLDAIPGLFMPLDYRLEPIEDRDFDHFWSGFYAGEPYGQWAAPDVAALSRQMRMMVEARETWMERAAEASAIIRRLFDWKNSAAKALVILKSDDR